MELKIIDGLMQTKAVDAEKRSVDAVMSTDTLDRFYERIQHDSWKNRLARFMSSPVLLKDHDHTQPIGHWENVKVGAKGLTGTAIFAKTDAAEERFALHRDGHVKAFSVGFIPHKWSYKNEDIDGKPREVRVFEDCELIECSSVAVPANPDALQRLMRSVAGVTPETVEQLLARMHEESMKSISSLIVKQLDPQPGSALHTALVDIAETLCLPPGNESDASDQPDTVSDETARAVKELTDKLRANKA